MQKNIPSHEKPVWDYSDMFSDGAQVVCYYHRETEFLGRHKHKFYEINIIAEGSGTHLLGESSCEAATGTVFVIPPGIEHAYRVEKPLVIFHVLLSGTFMETYRVKLQELSGYSLLFEIEPYIRGQFSENMFLKLTGNKRQEIFSRLAELSETARSTYTEKDSLSGVLTFAIIGILCRCMTEQNPLAEQKNLSAVSVETIRILEYIHENLAEKIQFAKLAETYNMTYASFLRQFKKVMKTTPLAYQNARRIEAAKHLLLQTDATVSFIAAECGFYDSSHFIRFFEKRVGVSPVLFRNQNRKDGV